MRLISLSAALACACFLLSGCATSPKDFYADPAKADGTALCRAYMDARDPKFQADVASELNRRGFTYQTCQQRITSQNVGIGLATAAVLGTAAVVACENGGCTGSGGYSGGYGYAWDNISNGYGGREWRCRSRATGEFADDYLCPAFKTDAWPYN